MPLVINPELFIDTEKEGLLCLSQITCVGKVEEFGSQYRFFITAANGTVFVYANDLESQVIQKRNDLLDKLTAALGVKYTFFEMFEGHMTIPLISLIFPIVESGRFYSFQVMMGTTSIFFTNYCDDYDTAVERRNSLIQMYQENTTSSANNDISSEDNYYV